MAARKTRKILKVLKRLLILVLALIVLAGGYVAYVFLDWHRLPDNETLYVVHLANGPGASDRVAQPARVDTPYRIVSWNIGFGAYEDDYGFFMDGGTQSWAWSKERLDTNLRAIAETLFSQNADLVLVQEVDTDSTRSYHVDEQPYLCREAFPGEQSCYDFAVNYDSPFLFYPFTQPHGASKAGIMTFSSFPIRSALRRSLPIEESVMKLVDLDRCYSVSRVAVEQGELVLYNFHLSAYTSDGVIATQQLRMLLEDMQAEYEAGNWCIAGGDFNKDLLGDSSVYFGKSDIEYSWAQPIPAETFDGVDITLEAPLDETAPVPSCRNADGPYHLGQYVLTIDGFLASPNVEVLASRVVDTAFRYSDHNPVQMDFVLR